ncbi:Maf family protein [Aeromicrobium fastidiosum]|uniref:Nucleoside triphosphate pyrophosphatase n=1 Tax=Aeromicrobium fastidiosum TaxID=52699 RepID=A0A641AJQ7_9ACTN|nr:nucleoside triphosphate pyrophosphatase [Aeromicrobium fastidiosum]KAA1372972.1 septum formation inhibitor Maf [Aeromicrobium fastidiosum]MBP2390941.1 septum formation protein [Aeromicrobium fastidiosum]
MRIVLASQSPARLATLRSAGIEPEVIVSGVDETVITSTDAGNLAAALAQLKCRAVAARVDDDALVIGCDSVLAFGGEIFGKPHDAAEARNRWRRMRGRTGVLHTGHCVRRGDEEVVETAATVVHFAELTDAEIDAYVATGEPLHVAGAFTIDGLGGAFVTRIEGDHHNVVGLSLPLLRVLVADLDIAWTDLWEQTN